MVLLPLTRSVSPMQLVPQSIPSTTLAPGDPLPGLGVIDRVGVLDRRPGVRGDGGDRGLDLRVRPHRHRHLRAGADRRTDRRPAGSTSRNCPARRPASMIILRTSTPVEPCSGEIRSAPANNNAVNAPISYPMAVHVG